MTELNQKEVRAIKVESWWRGVLTGSLFASIIVGTALHFVILKCM